MFTFTLLFLTLSGLRAVPLGRPQKTSSTYRLPDGFQQGTEPSRKFLVDLNTGLVQKHVAFVRPSLGKGFGEMERRHWLADEVPVDVPAQKNGGGWVRVEEPSAPHLPDAFGQETEPARFVPDAFGQGNRTNETASDREPNPSGPSQTASDKEPNPLLSIPDGFRQGTEPSVSGLQTKTVACKGEVVNGNCYEFNPTLLAFRDAQALCRALAPNAELASVTTGDLHTRLVSLVTEGGKSNPALTWLGGTVENEKASWADGSEWRYSDWMPGHPNIHADEPVCVEMFKMDESWWTAADCELKRASVCSYRITA